MWASTRGLANLVNLVGRCLILRLALSPPLSFSFCHFERPSERSASPPSPAGIENASPSRPLAAPLTTPFLFDLRASSLEARTWKWGEGDNTKRPIKEIPRRQLLSHSKRAQLRLKNRQYDLKLRQQFSV
jgi:hypothetical protein